MDFFQSPIFTIDAMASVLQDHPNLPSEDVDSSSLDDAAETSHHVETMTESRARAWNLGGLVKTIALKSEGMFEAYRKDLQEFGSGLRNETKIIAEVAILAVKDLPASLETGAAKAQESIESVGQVIEDFSSSVWRGTSDIVAQRKHAALQVEENEPSGSVALIPVANSSKYEGSISDGKYSRIDALVRSMQQDSRTYCEEPEDGATKNYATWKSTFVLSQEREEIDALIGNNTLPREHFTRLVPAVVSEETFWTRYFYRFHKLRQTEDARENLVKRACTPEEEVLSWDTEEEAEDGEGKGGVFEDEIRPEASKRGMREKAASCVVEDASDSRKASSDDEDEIGWDDSNSKRSSNSEGSWEVPEVPMEEEVGRKRTGQDQEDDDLSWDMDHE